MPKIAQILVAAGKGARFGGTLPKQYETIAGIPILLHTLNAFARSETAFSQTLIVIAGGDPYIDEALTGLDGPKPTLVIGGASRSESVRNGLSTLKNNPPDRVLIHDAARPLVSSRLIGDVVTALDDFDAVVPVLPISDAVKSYSPTAGIGDDVDRAQIRAVQTPQGFDFNKIIAAYDRLPAGVALSDDIAVARKSGMTIGTVEGDIQNFKITFPGDLRKAEHYMRDASSTHATSSYTAVGQGFDVHRFEPGDTIWLCGIEIPAGISLKGHSDADVGLHALTDAILGALCDGDIGDHFPPSDPKWSGAPSHKFLTFAKDRVTARGGRIQHVDVTLICEKPKIKPHRDAMRGRIAELLDIAVSRVSVKATTTERLGFTGRGEGIAAQASATLSLQD